MVRDFLMVKIKINKQNCVINDEHDLEKKYNDLNTIYNKLK